MIYKDIVTKKVYKNKQGEEKASWNKVGIQKTTDDGKQFLELFMFPDTQFYLFEKKEEPKQQVEEKEDAVDPRSGIDTSEIPF